MRRLGIGPLRTRAADQRLRGLRGLRGHHEPPEVVWLEPELDDGADDPLLSPEPEELELDDPELVPDDPELVPDEPVPDEPVPWNEPEFTLVDPELAVPEDDPADDEPDEVEPVEDVVLLRTRQGHGDGPGRHHAGQPDRSGRGLDPAAPAGPGCDGTQDAVLASCSYLAVCYLPLQTVSALVLSHL